MILALTSLLLLLAGPAVAEPLRSLVPVPQAALAALSPADREQLAIALQAVEELDAGAEITSREKARALGRLGSLYLLYDFTDSAEPALENARSLAPDEFEWPYYLGVLHTRDGDLIPGLRSFERCLEIRPQDLAARIRLGRILLDVDRPDEAADHFRAVLEIDAGNAAAHAGLGRAALAMETSEMAVEHLLRAVEIQPQATTLHHQLGLAYRKLGNHEAAAEHLARNTYGPVVFADPLMDRLGLQVRSARAYLKRGNQALEQGRLAAAVGHYRRGVEIDPQDKLLHYNLALALIRSDHDRSAAIEHLRMALELDPEYRDAHYNLAAALAQVGERESATTHFERAYRIDPSDHLAHLEWARGLMATDERQSGVSELKLVLQDAAERRPEIAAQAALELARDATVDQPAEAEAHFRRALELDPELTEAHSGLGRVLAQRGEFPEAADEYRRAVETAPENSEAWFGAAMATLLAEDEAGALEILEAALQAIPTDTNLTHALARLLAAASSPSVRDGQRAVALAEGVFRSRPSLDHAETLAMAYAEVGDFEQAVRWQSEVLARARRAGDSRRADAAARRLELYQDRQPIRSPWAGGSE